MCEKSEALEILATKLRELELDVLAESKRRTRPLSRIGRDKLLHRIHGVMGTIKHTESNQVKPDR